MKKQLINLEPVKEQVRNKLLEKYDSTVFMNTNVVDIKVDIKEILEEYIEQKQLTEPTIYITTEAYIKMRKLVDDVATEIGWYGTVTKCPGLDNTYIIEDIIVYPQIVTGATCEQDEDKMFEFEMSLTDEQVNHKRFQGHSHVNMGVGPSGVDEQFYLDLLSQVNDYFIIAITNKRNDYTVRFYDIENNILYSDLNINILLDNGTDLNNWITEAKENLHNRITTMLPTSKATGSILNSSSKFKANKTTNFYGDEMVYDPRFGYIPQEELDWFNRYYTHDGEPKVNNKKGRPKKGDK